jgi:group I intron endonuclease
MIGIYRIRNLVNDKCYYGSSKEIQKRWKRHKNDLINDKHINIILQRAWNKYRSYNFAFEIVETCEEEELFDLEQLYLNKNPAYNIGIHASGGDNLTKNPNRHVIIENIKIGSQKWRDSLSIEERKQKLSKPMEKNPNWKGGLSMCYCKTCGIKVSQNAQYCKDHIVYDRAKEKNAFYNKTHSDEVKKLISEKNKGRKPPNMKKVMIDNIVYESLSEASRHLSIPSPTILWRINSKNKKYENYQSHPSIKAPLSN